MANARGEQRARTTTELDREPRTGPDVAALGADPAPAARRVRKSPTARRAQLVATAREVLAVGGLSDGGMADVAEAASVSKGLLYHYFPAGRPDLIDAVAQEFAAELIERVARAAALPFSPSVRLEHVLAALFAYFDEHPTAYRVLFIEVDRNLRNGPGAAACARLARELTALLAGSGVSADQLLALSAGLVGFVLANVELCLAGVLDTEGAWRASCRCAHALLAEPS
jgi:AcrR family transcriptional regulator